MHTYRLIWGYDRIVATIYPMAERIPATVLYGR